MTLPPIQPHPSIQSRIRNYGAVYLQYQSQPPNYALYWNDMGSWSGPPLYNDDLGYANAVTEFTCPTPGNPGTSGPPALIY